MSKEAARSKNRSGATMVLVAVGLVAFFGFAALAVDVGMIGTGKAQARRAAEAGALGAAVTFMNTMVGTPDTTMAMQYADTMVYKNSMLARLFSASDSVSVVFVRDSFKFRVTVTRPSVSTFFARAIGFPTKRISERAAAAILSSTTASCLKPFGIPKRAPYFPPDSSEQLIWNQQDDSLRLIGFDNFPPGTGNLSPYIANTCASGTQTLSIGSTPPVAPDNNRLGQVRSGMYDMICADPNLFFKPGFGFTRDNGLTHADDWRDSPRVANVAMFDPTAFGPGTTTVPITGFMTIFFQRMDVYKGGAPPDASLMPVPPTLSPPDQTFQNAVDCTKPNPGGGAAVIYGRTFFIKGTPGGGPKSICDPTAGLPCVPVLVE